MRIDNNADNQTAVNRYGKDWLASFIPSDLILSRYASVFINYALNSGQGIKAGEVVELLVPDIAKPILKHLQSAVLRAGGHPMTRLLPTGNEASFYQLANQEQLTFFPKKLLKSRADTIDHQVAIIADPDPLELAKVDPAKIIVSRDAKKAYRDWLIAKENQGRFTWSLGLWGVSAKAELVGLSLEEYWQQIIQACFLDFDDPIAKWRQVGKEQERIKAKLNALEIEKILVFGSNVNLQLTLGANRLWQGGSGRNIPSFEIFTSPDWRGTEGWIEFNQPLYRYGQIIEGIRLEFRKGRVSFAKAKKGNRFLQAMLKSKNADKLGEFSLTDASASRISHPMAETLFDENMGGKYGNTHIAIGMSYKDCYRGDPSKVSKKQWQQWGYNESAEHTDIVSTTDRQVTAVLTNGTSLVIYNKGHFVL